MDGHRVGAETRPSSNDMRLRANGDTAESSFTTNFATQPLRRSRRWGHLSRGLQLGVSRYNVSATIEIYAAQQSGAPSRRRHFMRRAKSAARHSHSPATGSFDEGDAAKRRRGRPSSAKKPTAGLRERKKARLRQQIVETALHLFSPARVREDAHRRHRTHFGNQPAHVFPLFPQQKTRYCAKWDAVRLRARRKA